MVIWPTRALAAHAMEWIAYAPYAFASHMKHTGYYSLACKHAVRSTAPHPHASLPEHQLLTTICGINVASPFSKGDVRASVPQIVAKRSRTRFPFSVRSVGSAASRGGASRTRVAPPRPHAEAYDYPVLRGPPRNIYPTPRS